MMNVPTPHAKVGARAPVQNKRFIEAGETARRRPIQTVEVRRPAPAAPKVKNEEDRSTFEVEMLRAWSLP